MTDLRDTPEWIRLVRGWPAYVLAIHTPIDRIWWGGYLWLLQYAGEWAHRDVSGAHADAEVNQ